MEQTVGPDGIGFQIDGSNNIVTLIAGAMRLVLDRRHLFKSVATTERELLLTERRATDLVGRDSDLAELDAWLAAATPIACRCLVARAGTGKTRLAIELCERAEAAGWNAGFARSDELQRFFAHRNLSDWRWNEKALIVVDYAAASAPLLRQWLAVLARHPPCAEPLRLLLLERHADPEAGWWAELARPGGLSGPGPDALLDPAGPVVLPSLRTVEDRRALFAQAMAEAVRVLRPSVAPALPAPGTNPDFERRLADDRINTEPLYLLMAGLVAVTTGVPAALSLSRIDLALRVAGAERDRLDRLALAGGIDPALFRHLAACVTLQGGCSAEAATRLVEAERAAIGDRSGVRTDLLVGCLVDALPLPGSGAVDAVRPDLIGEAFLWQHLTGARRSLDAQCAIVARAFSRAGTPVVTTVIHAAQDLAAGSAGHATVAWLDHLVGHAGDVAALIAIADELPEQTLALREHAAEITARLTDLLRADAARDPDWFPTLASALNNLSNRLTALGRREAALAAIKEAVAIRRALAAARPGAFRADLARSLNNLSNRLFDLGRHQAALAASEDAVALTRSLAAALPDALHPDLALSLHTLSNTLSNLSRNEEALAAIEEAVMMRRALAVTSPGTFRPDLASSLNNLSNRRSDLNRREEALAAIEEAVAIRRELVATLPDAFLPDLADSLNNLSIRLSKLGRREAGLAASREAVAIARALTEARPNVFRSSLALSLHNHSSRLSDLGRCAEASAAIAEAVTIRRDLAAQRPDAFGPRLALSLWALADCLDETGDPPAGVTANAEAITVLTPAFLLLPAAFAPRMAGMVREYAKRCEKLGCVPDASLLAPVLAAFESLRTAEGNSP